MKQRVEYKQRESKKNYMKVKSREKLMGAKDHCQWLKDVIFSGKQLL
jgi:hypothetical protein